MLLLILVLFEKNIAIPLIDATRAIIVGRKNHEYLFSVKLSKTFCIKNG